MLSQSKAREVEEAKHPPPTDAEVQEALGQILGSQPFRTSKQCKDLLRYVVDHSLSGDDTALRERVIGAEVFGRKPSYDTNEDPVVRMRATDVRKRLAQFYQSLDAGAHVLHIELQPGSYRVHFRRDSVAPPDVPAPTHAALPPQDEPQPESFPQAISSQRGFIPGKSLLASCAVLLILLIALTWYRSSWASPQDRFWAPLTTNKQPVLLYLGCNMAYVFSSDFMARYRTAHGLANTGPEIPVELPPGSSVAAADIVPVKDTFVTTADTAAMVQVTTQLRDWKKPFVLRSGSDLSMGDLRDRPSVLVGAFNNPWTLELTNDLPFSFREGVRIQEREQPHRSWSVPLSARDSKTDDYALVTRLLSSKTGGPTMIVAGIGEYGTQAAAELITNPERLRDLLSSAPAGWEKKNMQTVLHVTVMGYQPVAIEVLATAYW